MAEVALFGAVAKIALDKVTDLLEQEISLAWYAKKELKKLQVSLNTIKDTLQAFEEGQYVKTLPTDNWLVKLKDMAYDAEDVLDAFATEVWLQQTAEKIRYFIILDEVCEFSTRLLYNCTLGHKIKKIRERLDEITQDKSNFHPTTPPTFKMSVVNNENIETDSSLSDPSSVVGRYEEKLELMLKLLDLENHDAQNVPPVIAIAGMPGVGKTTLARLVFNDETIEAYFDLRIWVSVSDDFEAKTIAKRVIECITEENCDLSQMETVKRSLRKKLRWRRYLLVLDDVWNENHDKWMQLKGLFMGGGHHGSKILVTTRCKQVADIMSTTSETLELWPLWNYNDCWTMFSQRAFKEVDETLVSIGKQIVENCKGVPGVIAGFGSLLHSNTEESYWRFVRDNEIPKVTEVVYRNQGKSIDILNTTKFSYNHLPSHLKACFAYCSLFPKDYEINTMTLIHLWMANGLIQAPTPEMEDVGYQYFKTLLSRSFFQEEVKDKHGKIISCKMHGLMRDLARSVAGMEYLIVGEDTNTIARQGGDVAAPQKSTRHIWFFAESNPQLFKTAHKLRSLLKSDPLKLHCDDCLSFKRLRALDLSRSDFERLPDSIGKLKHLRYLDLSYSRIESFPDSFSSGLQNLQTLNVSNCVHLKELPRDMRKMVNLRHIFNKGTSLTHMPCGLGQLSSLQTLSEFVLGKNIGSRISELGTLDGLRGELCIRNLEHVRDSTDAMRSRTLIMKEKRDLKFLTLKWDSGHTSEQTRTRQQQNDGHVWEHLHPPSTIMGLVIHGYTGAKFPSWMSKLKSLLQLELCNLSGCQQLEFVGGGFTSLKELYLKDLPKVVSLPNSLQHATSLQSLKISKCSGFTTIPEWLTTLTSLQELHLRDCSLVTSLPKGMQHLTRLHDLKIWGCPHLYRRCQPETGEDWAEIAHVKEKSILEHSPPDED